MIIQYYIKQFKIYFILSLTFITLFFVYLNIFYFTYKDKDNDCVIKIKTPTFLWNVNETKRALKILKYGLPDEYEKVCKYVNTINTRIEYCGFEYAGCFKIRKQKDSKYEISVNPTDQSFSAWEAAAIAHETCHLIQYIKEHATSEPKCYDVSNKAIKELVQY